MEEVRGAVPHVLVSHPQISVQSQQQLTACSLSFLCLVHVTASFVAGVNGLKQDLHFRKGDVKCDMRARKPSLTGGELVARSVVSLIRYYAPETKKVALDDIEEELLVAATFHGEHEEKGPQHMHIFERKETFTEEEKDVLECVVEDGHAFRVSDKNSRPPSACTSAFAIDFYTHCTSMGNTPYANNLITVGNFKQALTMETLFDVDTCLDACSYGRNGFNYPQVPTQVNKGVLAMEHYPGLQKILEKAMKVGESALRTTMTPAQFKVSSLPFPFPVHVPCMRSPSDPCGHVWQAMGTMLEPTSYMADCVDERAMKTFAPSRYFTAASLNVMKVSKRIAFTAKKIFGSWNLSNKTTTHEILDEMPPDSEGSGKAHFDEANQGGVPAFLLSCSRGTAAIGSGATVAAVCRLGK